MDNYRGAGQPSAGAPPPPPEPRDYTPPSVEEEDYPVVSGSQYSHSRTPVPIRKLTQTPIDKV